MILLETRFARTIDTLVERFSASEWAGARVEAWVFEDLAKRRDAEAELRRAGVSARVRSAYKPLLHAFLEDGIAAGPIGLPTHPAVSAGRFALEAYPLAALMPEVPAFVAGDDALHYRLADGTSVFAPNRVTVDPAGAPALSSCGWLRVWRGDALVIDEWLQTEFEQARDAVLAAVRGHEWPVAPPFFPTLRIDVVTAGICRPLGVGHECVDTREALHEELYFGLLEVFQTRAGLAQGDRTFQPGQIVPLVRAGDGDTMVRVSVVARLEEAAPLGPEPVETAGRALDAAQIGAIVGAWPGEHFEVRSVQGRAVAGVYRAGAGPGLVVTAGQHANETSGVVGLLRAAPVLLADPEANVALVALENPDGYAVHRLLCVGEPRHMHHAARYTALGDDLEARRQAPFYESEARRMAIARTQARLHLSLHGYPAQEWTRPLSGYVPAGFGSWTLPCGFFLIMRHHAGLADQAMAFLEKLTAELANDAVLMEMNRSQLALRAAHGGGEEALVLHGIACRMSESTRSAAPFVLITEYPDETITGPDFVQAHTVQRNTVLAAAKLVQAGVLEEEVG